MEEKKALLSFINQLVHDNSYDWNPSKSPCSWKGVLCDPTNTTVIQLSLSNAQLVGSIPENTIGYLDNLLILSLRGNYLSGGIPSDFSNLVLNELYLNDNKLTGSIPYINSMDLDQFNISGNNLSCRIPGSLSSFPNTSFSRNEYLCGRPLSVDCNSTCPYQYRLNSYDGYRARYISVGVSLGVALVVLIILCCFRRKIRKLIEQRRKPSLDSACGTKQEEENKLVLFDVENNDLVWDELVEGSAEVLGRDSVGTSYKRVLVEKKMTVVLKRLKNVAVAKTAFESRMDVLGKTKNEYVVPLRGYYYSKDEQWLVYDCMHGGSLYDHLRGLREAKLNWNHRKRIALSAARGVAYLHVSNVVHGNIQSSNVLLQQETNEHASVSDYGLNTIFDTCSSPNRWVTGYTAPEFLRTQKFSTKSDVYSFGVLLLELLTGKFPDQASTNQNDFPMWIQFVICKEPKVEILDTELRRGENMKEMLQMLQIAKDCASIVPDQRPTMLDVVRMMEEIETIETIITS